MDITIESAREQQRKSEREFRVLVRLSDGYIFSVLLDKS